MFLPKPEQVLDGAAGHAEFLGDGPDRLPGLVEQYNTITMKHTGRAAKLFSLGVGSTQSRLDELSNQLAFELPHASCRY